MSSIANDQNDTDNKKYDNIGTEIKSTTSHVNYERKQPTIGH